mmetsp:Transcript_84930/g.150408  ORF Transcript_84930/g.150408 Transcript_84930/m.150408 type:complete len:122 (-) Transcript_84930:73-438(-)
MLEGALLQAARTGPCPRFPRQWSQRGIRPQRKRRQKQHKKLEKHKKKCFVALQQRIKLQGGERRRRRKSSRRRGDEEVLEGKRSYPEQQELFDSGSWAFVLRGERHNAEIRKVFIERDACG